MNTLLDCTANSGFIRPKHGLYNFPQTFNSFMSIVSYAVCNEREKVHVIGDKGYLFIDVKKSRRKQEKKQNNDNNMRRTQKNSRYTHFRHGP